MDMNKEYRIERLDSHTALDIMTLTIMMITLRSDI